MTAGRCPDQRQAAQAPRRLRTDLGEHLVNSPATPTTRHPAPPPWMGRSMRGSHSRWPGHQSSIKLETSSPTCSTDRDEARAGSARRRGRGRTAGQAGRPAHPCPAAAGRRPRRRLPQRTARAPPAGAGLAGQDPNDDGILDDARTWLAGVHSRRPTGSTTPADPHRPPERVRPLGAWEFPEALTHRGLNPVILYGCSSGHRWLTGSLEVGHRGSGPDCRRRSLRTCAGGLSEVVDEALAIGVTVELGDPLTDQLPGPEVLNHLDSCLAEATPGS
jgi:hypothetical protein